MINIIENLNKINSNIKKLNPRKPVNIVAVSKTFSLDHIKPLIDIGHLHFGENKVQEANVKWQNIKKTNKNLKLHMVGKIQSNKAKNAFEIFDFIHSLDNQKLADIFSKCEVTNKRKINYFIQVNIGNEIQKSGVPVSEVDSFYDYCVKERHLNVIGLMIIPPNDNKTKKYFKTIDELNSSLGLQEISMGMSSDYIDAINCNATYVRIGSSIFGSRS